MCRRDEARQAARQTNKSETGRQSVSSKGKDDKQGQQIDSNAGIETTQLQTGRGPLAAAQRHLCQPSPFTIISPLSPRLQRLLWLRCRPTFYESSSPSAVEHDMHTPRVTPLKLILVWHTGPGNTTAKGNTQKRHNYVDKCTRSVVALC